MPGFSVTSQSTASPAQSFAVVYDGSTWPLWSPIDEFSTEPAPPRGSAPGAESQIRRFRTGRSIGREQVVRVGPGFRMEYIQVPGGPLVDYCASIEVTEGPDGGSSIHWQGRYRRASRFGLTWLMTWYLPRFMKKCVEGAADYASRRAPT